MHWLVFNPTASTPEQLPAQPHPERALSELSQCQDERHRGEGALATWQQQQQQQRHHQQQQSSRHTNVGFFISGRDRHAEPAETHLVQGCALSTAQHQISPTTIYTTANSHHNARMAYSIAIIGREWFNRTRSTHLRAA
jgi:hypothetical protein